MSPTTEIRRLANGAIDTAYYQRRGDKLRSEAAHDGLKKISRHLTPSGWLQALAGNRDKAGQCPIPS